VDLEALYPWVMPQVKACPPQVAIHHIREALIQFATKTLAWQSVLSITTTAIAESYLMPLPAGSTLVKLLRAGLDAEDGLDIEKPDTASRNSNLRGRVWTEDRRNVLLSPIPAVAGPVLKLRVALAPTRATLVIDDQLFEDFAPAIADGALATLFDMSNVTWADPMKAADKARKFKTAHGTAAARVAKGFGRSTRSVKPF
jgi:hypothetical protein